MPPEAFFVICDSREECLGTRQVLNGLNVLKITAGKLAIAHYGDVIMSAMASQVTSITIVYSTVYSGADQRKHQSSTSLAFVRGIHQWPMNSPHKGPVTRKMFPFDDVITIRKISDRRIAHNTHKESMHTDHAFGCVSLRNVILKATVLVYSFSAGLLHW